MSQPANIHTPSQPAPEQVDRSSPAPATFLELGQYTRDRSVPVPPAPLSARVQASLWLLRVFALTVSFMVIYAFVARLG
jgi:hypothetical protein